MIWGIICLRNAAYAAMADIQTDLFQFLSHMRPAIAAKAETRLLLDVRQRDQTRSLPAAGRTVAERS